MNNLLNQKDQAFIYEQLGINYEHQKDKHTSILEKYDMCYQQSLEKFKSTHLNHDNRYNKKSDTIVSQIINAGIV